MVRGPESERPKLVFFGQVRQLHLPAARRPGTTDQDGTRWAPLFQATADLLTGPGRSPADVEALVEWMLTKKVWRA